jgi:hypothetical protein
VLETIRRIVPTGSTISINSVQIGQLISLSVISGHFVSLDSDSFRVRLF